jgi:hypothetical protein
MVATHHVSNDFNGDGRSDLLWHNDDGRTEAWLGLANGGFLTSGPIFPGGPLFVTGDFNGDGRTDVLQYGSTVFGVEESARDGSFYFNYESATSFTPNWTIAGAGDFNGDGYSDILWRSTSGAISDWLGYTRPDDLNFLGDPIGLFKDNVATAGNSVSTDWHVAGIADFNGDGRDDILWRNDDGRLTDWLGTATGGFQPNSGNLLEAVSTDWKVVGVGDFNGDGKADILWRNADGRITDWLGTGTGAFTDNVANAYNSVSLDWHVEDIGDFNGDGRADIAWRNDDGRVTDWLGTTNGGFQPNSANALYGVPNDWHIVSWQSLAIESGAGAWDY